MTTININLDAPIKYSVGDWFIVDHRRLAVLSQTGPSQVQLLRIHHNDSNRYHDPVTVSDINNITAEELDLMCNCNLTRANVVINATILH